MWVTAHAVDGLNVVSCHPSQAVCGRRGWLPFFVFAYPRTAAAFVGVLHAGLIPDSGARGVRRTTEREPEGRGAGRASGF